MGLEHLCNLLGGGARNRKERAVAMNEVNVATFLFDRPLIALISAEA